MFLRRKVAQELKAEDLPNALKWARGFVKSNDFDESHELASAILERAVKDIAQPAVLEKFADTLFERMREFTDSSRITSKLSILGDSARRAVAKAMFPIGSADRNAAYFIIEACALNSHDVAWLMNELSSAPDSDTRKLVAELICRRFDPADISTFDGIFETALAVPELKAEIEPLVRAIPIESEQAERSKKIYRLAANPKPKPENSHVPVAGRLAELLSVNDPAVFFRMYRVLAHDGDSRGSGEALPGWSELEAPTKVRLLCAAYDYIHTCPPQPPGTWWKDGRFTEGMLAGGVALRLLAMYTPSYLDRVTDADWEFWTRVILTYWGEDPEEIRSVLLAKAYERVPATFLAALAEVIDGENERNKDVFVLATLGGVWDDQLAATLRSKLTTDELTPQSFRRILAKLLSKADPEATSFARSIALGAIPPDGDARQRAVNATAELLSHALREWSAIWPALQQNQSFGVDVLQAVAYEHYHDSFAASLEESQIAEICIWMAQHGLEKAADGWEGGFVTPSIALAQWWNSLINVLIGKGTQEACAAIERLINALPQYEGLKSSLTRAREITRGTTWAPLPPSEVLRLTADKSPSTLVISIHGIRTHGRWQKMVNSEVQRQGFRHELLDYGYFSAFQFLLHWSRSKKVDWFRAEYERLTLETKSAPSIIAHSFGTYIVARALEKYSEIRFNRIIFSGSIVRRDFDWESLLSTGRVGAVLNQCGGRDPWVRLAAWLIPDAGPSGVSGFSCSNPALYQPVRSRFRHSDYFYPLNYTRNWIPFLVGGSPEKQPIERKHAANWRFTLLLACLCILVVLSVLLLFHNR